MKKSSGFTLLEVVLAVGVLAVASVALFAAFGTGLTRSVHNHTFTMASIEAQMQMEQLIGLDWYDLAESDDSIFSINNPGILQTSTDIRMLSRFKSNNFWVEMILDYCVDDTNPYSGGNARRSDRPNITARNPNNQMLVEVTVLIFRDNTTPLAIARQQNILNVSGNIA